MKYFSRTLFLAVGLLSLFACTAKTTHIQCSAWFPAIGGNSSGVGPGTAKLLELAGIDQKPNAIWYDQVDVNGDLREDAVLTLGFMEGAGARGQQYTRVTYVFLGERDPHAVFSASQASYWFSIVTHATLFHAKYPDEELRRQFSLREEQGVWCLDIHEEHYTNHAGDAWSRGMFLEEVREFGGRLNQLDQWLPKSG